MSAETAARDARGADRRTGRVVVLAGGLSYERDVSLRSGRRVSDALRRAGLEAVVRDADAALLPALADDRPDAVVIALHGATGEDGALRGVLDLLGMPYVGSDALSSRRAWDKPSAKAELRRAGLATPEWVALPHDTFRELGAKAVLERIADVLGLPLMVKPAQGGSGLGATTVHRAEDLPAAMVGCFAYGGTALLERFQDGVAVAVGVVEHEGCPRALPAVEIVAADGRYDYAARYTAGVTTWHAPARLDEAVAAHAADVALRAHRALGLRDLSRVDLVVDADGEAHVLEVKVSPGMTETSLLPLAVQAAGLELGDVLRELVHRACARPAGLGLVPVPPRV